MTANTAKKEDKPHYSGHRDRLRERFVGGGTEALADYELLELILFMAIPRRDVKPLAKDLIKTFGSFAGVINAPLHQLTQCNGLSENSAIALKTIQAGAHKLLKQEIINQPILNSRDRLNEYLSATMAHETKEHFRVLFLNKKNELIADEIQHSGTVDHTTAYPREIMKRAIELGATALILCHNHPSGDTTPSDPDIIMTNQIVEAAKTFSIVVHDHIIVSKKGSTSFRNMGLLT